MKTTTLKLRLRKLMGACSLCVAAACAIALSGCASQKQASGVAYTEAHNYFFRNDATPPSDPMITSQEQFDALFGCAATMGPDGMPTPIDFGRQFAIAVVLPATDVATDLRLGPLTRQGDTLVMAYAVKEGKKQTYTTQPVAIAIVDRQAKPAKVVLARE